ncbi:MAG: GNAT family N-acetyltransferase [Acidimicrobiia bacterium]|nr:GNAT family N-acetyltransferase [Acidimicrobiia bacterium]MDH5236881.1 GNAT family N-acetyltransferase [Acidimicrobiia bacterium]
MDEACRPALPADLTTLAELVEAAVDELTPTKGGAVWARREAGPLPATDRLSLAMDDEEHLVVVGTLDDVVVGYGMVHVESVLDGGRLGRITDIYVLPDARGVGVGEELMGAIVSWATDAGCFGVDSLALPGNRATKNFFETHGLVARAIVVHRSIDR